jgi:hypothetical protein
MKQVASRSIYFESLIFGCSNKLVQGPLRGGNQTRGAGITLAKGVRAYKRLKVEVGWTEIFDARVCAIICSTRRLIILTGGILKKIYKRQISNPPNAQYIYKTKSQIYQIPNSNLSNVKYTKNVQLSKCKVFQMIIISIQQMQNMKNVQLSNAKYFK